MIVDTCSATTGAVVIRRDTGRAFSNNVTIDVSVVVDTNITGACEEKEKLVNLMVSHELGKLRHKAQDLPPRPVECKASPEGILQILGRLPYQIQAQFGAVVSRRIPVCEALGCEDGSKHGDGTNVDLCNLSVSSTEERESTRTPQLLAVVMRMMRTPNRDDATGSYGRRSDT